MKQPKYSPADEQALMSQLWSPMLADDPYAYVMFAFPWGKEGTPLAKFKGPRKWQRKVLKTIARHIAEGKTIDIPKLLRIARASGRGIGKSALVAWLVMWFLSTRIGSTVIISANTEDQLRKITFAELSKWLAMAINEHWFELNGITMKPAKWLAELVKSQLQKGTEYWGADGKLWSEENPDAYAGPHNHDGMMVIFDEASGIPDGIWSVANGYFTEPTANRFWFAFSQGRRNAGYFYDIFGKKVDLWDQEQIDARTVEGTDPAAYQEIIDEYGEESDEARVEVYGLFPIDDNVSFISVTLVEKAISRQEPIDNLAPKVMGIDPSGGGSDWFVIVVRQGRKVIDIRKTKITDDDFGTMAGVDFVIDAINHHKPVLAVIDVGGLGKPIMDRLHQQKFKVVRGVNFTWASKDATRWANKRAEMWASMKKWLETGDIPDDKYLKADLPKPKKRPDGNKRGGMLLESKKDMKARGLASPDHADALCVTFAFPVAHSGATIAAGNHKTVVPVGRGLVQAGAPSTHWMGC